jgi:hypothetical protein
LAANGPSIWPDVSEPAVQDPNRTPESQESTMRTRTKSAAVLTTALLGLGMLGVSGASAAHCSAPGDHAQSTAGPEHNEGEHQGWSSCVAQSNSDNDNNNRGGNR